MRFSISAHQPAVAAVALVAALTAWLPRPAAAQATGTLRGVVTGVDKDDSIPGACIAIERTGCSAVTNSRGAFIVRGLVPGQVTITVTSIGRTPVNRTVSITAGSTTTLDIALEPGPLLLSTMVVTATRVPTEANKVATTVNVLTRENIATSPARESQDLLREVPGVELPRTSSLVGGTAQIVSIRGVDEGRTAVLFDGIPINDAWGEWIDWGRAPKGLVDHVEVVEGGTSNLYGNGAIGGVISFFSRPMAPWALNSTIDGGSRDAKHAFISGGVPIAPGLTADVAGDFLQGGGYTMLDPAKIGAVDVPSEITQRNALLRLNYLPGGDWSAFASGHLYGDTRHLGTPLGLATRTQYTADVGINHGQLASGQLAVRAWTGHQDEFQRATTIRANSATCAVSSTAPRACEDSNSTASIPSDDAGLSAMWTRSGLFGLESFTVGGDYRHMGGEYDERDFNTSCPGASCGMLSRTIASGGDQYLSGAFVQAIAAPAAALRIELSGRLDRWENNNGHSNDPIAGDTTYVNRSRTAFSPRVGARYEFVKSFSMHAAVYQAFRAPNLAELYRKQINANASQITIPNPDLKPETGRGYEAGVDWQPAHWVQLKGTAYIANYNDFNVPTQIAAGPPVIRQRLNIARSRSKGAEVYLALRPMRELFVSASANYDDDRIVASDSTDGQHINRVPSPKYAVRASYTSRVLGEWTAIWRYEGRTTTLQGLPLAPFGVVDANVQREITPVLSGFVSIENIGNVQYQVNIAGTGSAALITYGLPRTVRAGFNVTR
jgi:outer membrane receptor protein involved in Fe transport